MNTSVVIAVSDDVRIAECLDSIDEDVEVIVSLNAPTAEVVRIVKSYGVRMCCTERRGLANALNLALACASHDKIIVIDSDHVCKSGAISALSVALDEHPMARGICVVRHCSWPTRITSVARSYHGNTSPDPQSDEIRAYKPIGYRKSVIPLLGGQMYDARVLLAEEYEMDERRRRAGIPVVLVPEAVVYHAPVPILRDLSSAYRYGQDRYRIATYGLKKPKTPLVRAACALMRTALPQYGPAVTTYLLLWLLALNAGFARAAIDNRFARPKRQEEDCCCMSKYSKDSGHGCK